jgi:hypothetical protein
LRPLPLLVLGLATVRRLGVCLANSVAAPLGGFAFGHADLARLVNGGSLCASFCDLGSQLARNFQQPSSPRARRWAF